MPTAKYRDPTTGQYVPILGGSGNAFTGAQVASAAPTPRGVGDLWVDTSATVLEWDTAWKVPTLINGWVFFGGAHATAGYRKTAGGLVVLKGLIMNGTLNVEVFTLPVGYRPKETLIISAPSNTTGGESGSVQIDGNGALLARTGVGNGLLSLSGITFFAEQ